MQEAFIIRHRVFLLDPEDMDLEMIHVLTVVQLLLAQWTEVLQAFSLPVGRGGNISMTGTHVQKHPEGKLGRA